MSECCASGSCEVCRPAEHGYPIERERWRKLQREAVAAHALGHTERERAALDELTLMERKYGTAVSDA